MAGSLTGPEQARQDLAAILSGDRVEMGEAMRLMAERGHPAGRVDRARRALGSRDDQARPARQPADLLLAAPDELPNVFAPIRP